MSTAPARLVAAAASDSPFYVTGGTLPTDASSYVVRQADTDLLDGLLAGEFCYVLNTRQMGKSSLMIRTASRLREQGVVVAVLDLTAVGQNLSPEQWYDGLLSKLGQQLRLDDDLEDFWEEHDNLGPMQRFFAAVGQVVLPALGDKRLVVFVDEIDAVRSLPFSADEFFAGIRECYNRRTQDVAWKRLVFCLLGVATPADLITDTRMSPFNVGRRIAITDFTPSEAAPLAHGLGQNGETLLARVLYWTNGHPYLTQRLCRTAAEANVSSVDEVDRLCHDLFLTHAAKESDDNLAFVRNRLLRSEADLAALLDLYTQVRKGRAVKDDETNPLCGVLRLSGAARMKGGLLRVRNRIYEHVFDNTWVKQHLPDAEKRRQKQAFRRGMLLAGTIAGVVLFIVASLGVLALRNYRVAQAKTRLANQKVEEARNSAEQANYNLYVARMNLIQQNWETRNVGYVKELLEATRARGQSTFEWGYWNRLCHLELLALKKHSNIVTCAVYFPDGKRIATGSWDKTARVWDARTGDCLLTFKGHSGKIYSIAIAPNSKFLLTGSSDGTAKMWDTATGKELRTLKLSSLPMWACFVTFSPDGKRIAARAGTYGAASGIKVWDTATGKELHTLRKTGGFSDFAFSPDGKRIAAGMQGDDTATVSDAATDKTLLTLRGHTSFVYGVAYSPDGRRIATGSFDGSVKVWDARTGKEQKTFKGQAGDAVRVAFSPDGKRIATTGIDGTAKIWDVRTGADLLTLKGHTQFTGSVAFSPDGKRVVTTGADTTAKVWDATTEQAQRTLHDHTRDINSVAFSPNGDRILTSASDSTAILWDAQTGKRQFTLRFKPKVLVAAAFSPSGKEIITANFIIYGKQGAASGSKTNAIIWNAATGKVLRSLYGPTGQIFRILYSPDGRRLVTVAANQSNAIQSTAKVWDAQTGNCLLTLKGDTVTVAFSPDGKHIVTGGIDNNTAVIRDALTGQKQKTLEGHLDGIMRVTFSPDGERVATASMDNTTKVWDAKTGTCLFTLRGHAQPVFSVAFSADGKRVLTASPDKTAKVWDAATGADLLTLKGHGGGVVEAAFSPNGKRIVTGSLDKTARIWFADDTRFTSAP